MDTPEKKTSVLFYTDWAKPLRSLPMEDVGQLFCAILEYTETGAVPQLDSPVAAMAWEFIRQRLDASIEKWDATREKRRQAGSRGGRQRAAHLEAENQVEPPADGPDSDGQTQANQANATFAKQTVANQAVTVPVPVPVPVPETENVPVPVPETVHETVPVSETIPAGACAPEEEKETTQLEQVWTQCGYDGAAQAARMLARYREKGLEEGLILEAIRQAASHGARSPLAYIGRILDQAAASGQLTLAAWQAAHRGGGGGGKRVDRPSPSGNDFLADAAARPRRHKRKG
ncbi:hypothetical protein B5G28_12885 [Faecalibacterium sp. An77]|uniref:DUF6291 domain-containing protein n=1 Tax=Faecalibacterium sp. An77 TaxID=1965655 RepID=UPI000B394286|nr:DUF6291 domain-containing protein [Faecalibacterium sp. An77]OUN34373.1 hypothetical protein B5G28_12885 [Faecalibacterium sp. An77]